MLLKWIDYLKPLIILKMKKLGLAIDQFHKKYVDMIKEIAVEHVGSPEGSAAASAIQVHRRITVAYEELESLKTQSISQKVDHKAWEQNLPIMRNHHRLY